MTKCRRSRCVPKHGYLRKIYNTVLQSYYTTPGSVFYTAGNTVTKQLTALVIKTYPIAPPTNADSNSQNAADNSASTAADNGRRNAIIGVCVAFGTIALAVFFWWLIKTRQQRRENAHTRLEYQSGPNYGTAGAPPMMAEQRQNDGRRNSFYAFGQDDGAEDETFDYISQHSHSGGAHNPPTRRPIAGQTISQPILRDTSMGRW